ncbi:MAG: hypothetical protein R2788_04180 [Saprospiraceae bacterium]
MKISRYKTLTTYQKAALLELWNNEYPAQLGYSDMAAFDTYLNILINVEHFLVEANDGKILGWYFHFLRDHAKWFVIILSSEIQEEGNYAVGKGQKNGNGTVWLVDGSRPLQEKKRGRLPLSIGVL